MAEPEGFDPWSTGVAKFEELKGQWDQFLEAPGGRTALLQFGLNLMQPPSFGDTGASQIGRAVGSAGEAVTRRGEIERRERESESKIDLAEARADAAAARARVAGQGSELGAQRLEIAKERIAGEQERRKLQTQMGLLMGYQRYKKDVEARNARAQQKYQENKIFDPKAPPPVLEPVLDENSWLQTPLAGALRAGVGMTEPAVGGPAQVTAPVPVTGPAVPAPGEVVNVTSPAEARSLPPGTRYRTPDRQIFRR